MIRTYGAGPPSRCCTRRASGSSCATSPARSVPGAMRATTLGPNPPGVTCAARIGNGTQNAMRSSGNRNSGFMMPITVRVCAREGVALADHLLDRSRTSSARASG